MPNQDNIFSQLLSRHVDPMLGGGSDSPLFGDTSNVDLFTELLRPPSYLDALSGRGSYRIRDPFTSNLFLKYLQGPVAKTIEDDPVQQLRSFIHPDVFRPQTRPEASTTSKTKQRKLSPYHQDVEKWQRHDDPYQQEDRMPMNILRKLLMRL
jgi:hypothetical protein